MILRGTKQLEGPKEINNDESLHDKNEHVENLNKEMSSPSNEVIDVAHEYKEVPKDPKITSPMPYSPPLQLLQRMAKAKLDSQFGQFLEVLKKFYINIPFTESPNSNALIC